MTVDVIAGRGPEAEMFATRLRRVYAGRDPDEDERGVHALTFRNPGTGLRTTVFALVGAGAWDKQARRYVLEPYRMTKNVVTGAETASVDPIIAGEDDLG